MSRAPVRHFERLALQSEDPWEYASSQYEQDKYRNTLEFLPDVPGRVLEMGCSIGVFTEMLAPRCVSLMAVDFSPTALARAEARVGHRPNVELQLRTLPEEMPEGPFDTIVCAEVLYYWDTPLVVDALSRMETALAPGGTLLCVHWRGSDERRSLNGDDVHRILGEETLLDWQTGSSTADYLLDSWKAR